MAGMTSGCIVLTVGILLGAAGLAHAASIPINNPSFEDDSVPVSPGWTHSGPSSWTEFGAGPNGMVTNVTGSPYADLIADSLDGTHQSVFSNPDPAGNGAYQVLSETLKANTIYTLKVDLGRPYSAFGGGKAELGYGNAQGVNFLTVSTSDTPVPSVENWATWTYTFVTGASPAGLGQALRIEVGSALGPVGTQSLLDNIRLDANPVPEPSVLALLATGLTGVLAYGWRKRKRAVIWGS